MQPLIAGPRVGLSEADVLAALSLEHAPRVRHGVTVLDVRDNPTGEVAAIDQTRGEVAWSLRAGTDVTQAATAAASVRRDATVTLVGPPTFPLEARRLLLWTEIQAPSGAWVRWHQGVFTIPPAAVRDDGVLVTRDLALADKVSRYDAVTLAGSLQVQAGTEPVSWVRTDLQSRFGETRFAIVDQAARRLTEDMTFEAGASLLTVYNALLTAVGYDALTTDEDGRPQARPLAGLLTRAPEITYGPGTPIVVAGSVSPLLPTLPNVVRFVARRGPTLPELGNGITVRRNESTGPGSIAARGEEVHRTEEVDADSQDALEAVADAEAQRLFAGGGESFAGQVGLNPGYSDRDVVGLTRPRLGLLGGAWLVTSWTYPRRAVRDDGDVLMDLTCERRVEVTA